MLPLGSTPRLVLLALVGAWILAVTTSPAEAGGRRRRNHFTAMPYRSPFIDADEARRAAEDIPPGIAAARPSAADRRLAALDAGILADARRGTELWEGSCIWQGDAGCTLVEVGAWPRLRDDLEFVWGPSPPRERRVAVDRDPVGVAHALAHLRRAESAWRRRIRAGGAPPQVRRAAAWALFLLSEHDFEGIYSTAPPRGLTFDTAEWMAESGVPEWEEEAQIRRSLAEDSHDRYYAYILRANQAVDTLLERYREILALHDLRSTVAVLSRSATLADEWTTILLGVRAPEVAKRGSGWYWHWEPNEITTGDHAPGVLRACVDVAARHGLRDDPFVRLCRRDLAQIDGVTFAEDDALVFAAALRPPRPETLGPIGLAGAPVRW